MGQQNKANFPKFEAFLVDRNGIFTFCMACLQILIGSTRVLFAKWLDLNRVTSSKGLNLTPIQIHPIFLVISLSKLQKNLSPPQSAGEEELPPSTEEEEEFEVEVEEVGDPEDVGGFLDWWESIYSSSWDYVG